MEARRTLLILLGPAMILGLGVAPTATGEESSGTEGTSQATSQDSGERRKGRTRRVVFRRKVEKQLGRSSNLSQLTGGTLGPSSASNDFCVVRVTEFNYSYSYHIITRGEYEERGVLIAIESRNVKKAYNAAVKEWRLSEGKNAVFPIRMPPTRRIGKVAQYPNRANAEVKLAKFSKQASKKRASREKNEEKKIERMSGKRLREHYAKKATTKRAMEMFLSHLDRLVGRGGKVGKAGEKTI